METPSEADATELYSLSVPNRAAGDRYKQLLLELWCNTPTRALDGRTPWEAVRVLGGLAAVEALLPEHGEVDPEHQAQRGQELQVTPNPDLRQALTLDRSGGLLNIFTDRPTPADDDDWRRLLAQARAVTDQDDPSARREAKRRAARAWNHLPSVLFAGLTPLQVIAGGGPREAALLQHLSAFLEQHVDPTTNYASPAAVARASLLLLRRWQVTPIQALDNMRPRQVILEERTEILERKLAFTAGQ